MAAKAPGAACAAVVKADGYGLGADVVVPAFVAAGADRFFVAHIGEGLAVRAILDRLGARARIGVLNGLPPDGVGPCRAADLTPVLNTPGEIALWRRAASTAGTPLPAYIHIDSGMNRLGLSAAEAAVLADHPERLDGLAIQAWISHLACADQADSPMTDHQAAAFDRALAGLPRAPISLANSSGIFRGAHLHRDLLRPGYALYGGNPTPEAANPMHRVVTLTAPVLQVRQIDTPGTVGYGAGFRVAPGAKIATVSMGYADGLPRCGGGAATVVIAGQPAPVVGRISMDSLAVDISAFPDGSVSPGTEAELIGPHADLDALATSCGTIGYEILTGLGARLRRRVIGEPL